MVDLNSSLTEWLIRSSNTSEPTPDQGKNQNVTIIIIVVIFVVVLIVIILVSYRILPEFCKKRKDKNRQKSVRSTGLSSIYTGPVRRNTMTESGRVSSLFAIPVLRGTLSDSRGVSSIYPVHVRSDSVTCVDDESVSCYPSVIPLQERRSEPLTRL